MKDRAFCDRLNAIIAKCCYGHSIYMAFRIVKRHLMSVAQDKGIEIWPEQWFLMNKLKIVPGQYTVELSDDFFLDRPNTTRMLASLEKKSLIRRKVDKNDRRKNRFYLTAKGARVHDEYFEIFYSEGKDMLRGLPPLAFRSFKTVLETVNKNLEYKSADVF